MNETRQTQRRHFLHDIVDADLESGRHRGVVTRFPPEPNGFLHIGHAKAICVNFGLAAGYDGRCHLRLDDTNPTTEDVRFVESIAEDVRWLGFDWGENRFFASDYYEQLHDFAVTLIRKGKAYVCSLDEEQIRVYRGTITEPGKDSPFRERSVEENLDLFARMRAGEFPEGAHVLRAKIDMSAPNMKLRDPPIYRIKHAPHFRTGDAWCIYPLYDFAHALSDALEGITHSICTLEFENNRDIYDWVIEHADPPCQPKQYEFARLNLSYTMMSKRKLAELVKLGHVTGWDDPRMPTLAGLRRRGVTPAAVVAFCDLIGVAKNNSVVDIGKLDYCIREDLNHTAPRAMAVLDPLRVEITNYPKGQQERFEVGALMEGADESAHRRTLPFSRDLWIDSTDFMEEPPDGYFRLRPGGEVRLRHAYVIRCDEVVKDDDTGKVMLLRCSYDPDTAGAAQPSGRKVKGTIHWLSADEAVPCHVHEYDRLFNVEAPSSVEDLNPHSLRIHENALVEPGIREAAVGSRYQFERHGYYCRDTVNTDRLVFNRIVGLRDSWAKKKPGGREKTEAGRQSRKGPKDRAKVHIEITDAMKPLIALGIADSTASQLSRNQAWLTLWEEAAKDFEAPQALANFIVSTLGPAWSDETHSPKPEHVARLVARVEKGDISSTAAKKIALEMLRTGKDPDALITEAGAEQISDESALQSTIDEILRRCPDEVARYREGKKALMGFFVGQVMKATGGNANAGVARKLLQEKLD